MQVFRNKKVLLRERKRHTARRIASARYSALSPGGGGGGVNFSWLLQESTASFNLENIFRIYAILKATTNSMSVTYYVWSNPMINKVIITVKYLECQGLDSIDIFT